VRLE
jgi:flagellin-specific chaperone FliS